MPSKRRCEVEWGQARDVARLKVFIESSCDLQRCCKLVLITYWKLEQRICTEEVWSIAVNAISLFNKQVLVPVQKRCGQLQ